MVEVTVHIAQLEDGDFNVNAALLATTGCAIQTLVGFTCSVLC